jgi:hypothetical protein
MANKGLQFEWCIYHLVAKVDPKKFASDANAKTAKVNYDLADSGVQRDAENAISMIEKQYGKIEDIEKTSGGGIEPKTDLYIKCTKKTIKCSLKHGGSIQLSSGGVNTTVNFLNGVLENLSKYPGYNAKKIKSIMSVLAELDKDYGDLGKMPRTKADVVLGKTKRYNELLQNILGSGKTPKVSEEYEKIKLAIIEEAITGKYTFGETSKLSADHILSEKKLDLVTPELIESVANKTSVRISLKGRGKEMVAGKEIRLNEIVIRFDTKA